MLSPLFPRADSLAYFTFKYSGAISSCNQEAQMLGAAGGYIWPLTLHDSVWALRLLIAYTLFLTRPFLFC